MKTLNVPDMHCEHCVARISKALDEKGIKYEISLEDKTVSIEETRAAEAAEVLEDLGFSC